MTGISDILQQKSVDYECMNSILGSGSNSSYIQKSRHERIYRIEIPFQHFHDSSTKIDFEANMLVVDAKMSGNSNYHLEKKLPPNLCHERMEHYYVNKNLIIDIPVRNESNIPSLLMSQLVGFEDFRSLQNQLSQKHIIEDDCYIISEDLGYGYALENMQLKMVKSSILILTAVKETGDVSFRRAVNLRREFKLPINQYDVDKISARYYKNHILKITIPILKK